MGQPPRLIAGWLPTLHVGRRLFFWMVGGLAYAAAVTVFVRLMQLPVWSPGGEVAAVLGLSIGTLVAFRNHSANDRWWEARKLWGQLINESRNLAIKARAHAIVEPTELGRFADMVAGFANALRLHLRGVSTIQAEAARTHAPGQIAGEIVKTIADWDRDGRLHGVALLVFDRHTAALMDICGGCERIRSTPLASSYRALLRGGITLYLLVAPWSLALEMGWWAVPVLAIALGYLLGTEFTAESIEEPFGTDGDDLPLESYCNTIESFVRAELGPLPTAAKSVDDRL